MRWLPLLALLACGDDGAAASGELGDPCGPSACAGELVCRDGECAARSYEADVTRDVETADADAPDALDAPDAPDPFDGFDATDTSGTADALEDSDTRSDAVDIADSDAVDGAGDVLDDADAGPEVTTIMIGEHGAAEAPSDTRLTLGISQAAVMELDVPEGSWRISGIELLPVDGDATCGRFRAVVWLPDDDGLFPYPVTWQSEDFLLAGVAVAQTHTFGVDAPVVTEGSVRAGVSYLGPCDGASVGAWIALDDSGDTADTWVWAGNWIPGATLGLPGRWAIRLALTAGLP